MELFNYNIIQDIIGIEATTSKMYCYWLWLKIVIQDWMYVNI